jgi:hypothetical protein
MADFEGELVQLLREFTSKVAVIVRQHALRSANAALSASVRDLNGGGRRQGGVAPAKKQIARKMSATTGEPFDKDAAGPQVVSFLLANPGLRMDELGRRLQLPTSSLKPLVKKLIASRMLRAVGNTRGRRYFPSRQATSATDTRPLEGPGTAKATHRRGPRREKK